MKLTRTLMGCRIHNGLKVYSFGPGQARIRIVGLMQRRGLPNRAISSMPGHTRLKQYQTCRRIPGWVIDSPERGGQNGA